MIGTVLDHYRILGRLGQGGMSDVYLALDLELEREVALKILPEVLAANPDALARFRREAKTLASLVHPNIVTVHEVGSATIDPASAEAETRIRTPGAAPQPGAITLHYLVMEKIEGRTLDRLIPRDGLPLAELLDVALAITGALAAVHDRGIVHRDLKPTNVMIHDDGHLKVLDFGLAKPVSTREGPVLPSAIRTVTQQGTVVGTYPYMSPEQIEGEEVDVRSDVFSAGLVLYESATGRRAFDKPTALSLITSILRDQPTPVSELRPDLPQRFGDIVARCMEKDPAARYASGAELRRDLDELRRTFVDSGSASGARSGARDGTGLVRLAELAGLVGDDDGRERARPWTLPILALLLIGVLGLAFGVGLLVDRAWRDGGSRTGGTSDVSQGAQDDFGGGSLSQLTVDQGLEEWPAFSPDGRSLVYSKEVDGVRQLFLRDLDSGRVRKLTDDRHDKIQATFTPDGASLVFTRAMGPDMLVTPTEFFGWYTTGGHLARLDLASGAITEVTALGFEPAVSPDGRQVAFSSRWAGPHRIWVTDIDGGDARQLSWDQSEAVIHGQPSWSPDGRWIVYRRILTNASDLEVVEARFDGGEPTQHRLTDDLAIDLGPQWSPNGRWVYFSSMRGGSLNLWRIGVDDEGRAVAPPTQLTTGAGHDLQAALSPDGARLAFVVMQQNADIWRLPVDPSTAESTGEAEALIASSRAEGRAAVSPDGAFVAFDSDRAGTVNLWLHDLANGAERPLTSGPGGDYQPVWFPGGRRVAFYSYRTGHADIWTLEVLPEAETETETETETEAETDAEGDTAAEPLQITHHPGLDIDPEIDPEGRRIAFHSDRSGRLEVWIATLGEDGRRVALEQLSTIGSTPGYLHWSDDGADVYYRSGIGPALRFVRHTVADGTIVDMPIVGGAAHSSFNPGKTLVLDSDNHETLAVRAMDGGPIRTIFRFDDPQMVIDYPRWSPDGRWIYFDAARPQGGDVWLLEGLGDAGSKGSAY